MKITALFSHHAILITHPDRDTLTNTLWKELAPFPQHVLHHETVLDIDTARTIISWANIASREKKVALISFHTITPPAQNALLKTLEEPREDVRFILVTSHKEGLLPTLRSRLLEHTLPYTYDINKEDYLLFLTTPSSLRLAIPFLAKLITGTDKEGRKDREGAQNFFIMLANVLGTTKVPKKYIEEVLLMAHYASFPSTSTKALLEYVALLLPENKDYYTIQKN